MLFELREYHTKPGQLERWIKFMDDVIIPYQSAKGMVIIASWVGEAEEDLYLWIRRFESEAERERIYKDVYQNDYWQNEISPQVGEMLDRTKTVVRRLTPTPRSVIR